MACQEGLEVLHCWLRLHVQVAHHIIRAPLYNQLDDVADDAGAEDLIGACVL